MKSELAFILDRSGSMESIRQAAIDGFNTFLRDQQAAPGFNRFSLVFFDSRIETRLDSIPVAEAVPLDLDTYVPSGGTALLDAIGDTIDRHGQLLPQSHRHPRPEIRPRHLRATRRRRGTARNHPPRRRPKTPMIPHESGWDILSQISNLKFQISKTKSPPTRHSPSLLPSTLVIQIV